MNAADKSLIRERIRDLKSESYRRPETRDANDKVIKVLKTWLVGTPAKAMEKVMSKTEMIEKLKVVTGQDAENPQTTMVIADRKTADHLWDWLKTGPNVNIQAPEDVKRYIQSKFRKLNPTRQ